MRNSLKKTGELAISVHGHPNRVPYFDSIFDAVTQFIPNYIPSGIPDFDRFGTKKLLKDEIKKAGFTKIKVSNYDFPYSLGTFEQYWCNYLRYVAKPIKEKLNSLEKSQRKELKEMVRKNTKPYTKRNKIIKFPWEVLILTAKYSTQERRDMVKDKKKDEVPKKKKSDFKAFLKKRAPIYLALIAMLVVFGIPELTKGNLEKSFPEFSAEEQQVVDILMKYDGGNGGYTMMNALTDKIAEEYPDEKIFDNKKTIVELNISNINSEESKIVLNFESHKGEMNFDWNVNSKTGDITSNNPESKYLIDKVDFYD